MNKYTTITHSVFIGLLLVSSVLGREHIGTGGPMMTASQNKKIVHRLFEEVFNQQSLTVIDELYAPDVTDHSAFPEQAPGVEGIKSAIHGFFEVFDNLKITVEDVIAEDDKVVTRETWTVTHKPTGKTVEGSVIHIFRVQEGKISDEWSGGWEWLENL